MKKYVAFDLEIAKVLPEGEMDWKAYRPLGITCAALAFSDQNTMTVHHTAHEPLDREGARGLVRYLLHLYDDGHTILTWNGLGFDFDILAEESGMWETCQYLAMSHVDMMFHFFCSKGFALGLDAAAKGNGLAGKPAGIDGALAPVLWKTGEYTQVLEYVKQDVRMTLALAQTVERQNVLYWTARSGRANSWSLGGHWLTVEQALLLPEPDVSWMDDPWPRSKFYGWITPPTSLRGEDDR